MSNLRITPLVNPTKVHLAINNGVAPEKPTKFTSAMIKCTNPELEMGATFFKLAPLHRVYDVIFGTPFLKKFNLDVSVPTCSVCHVLSGTLIHGIASTRKDSVHEEKKRQSVASVVVAEAGNMEDHL
ncbi:hypothetical protein CROQUDRAFT_137291 [Cronartium quercuum f. sp. fusiforme G11]|uniref:Uncharacterized protein n=1 Tax=Cronartium quercuum f. sp. fusiforme G11 TaxID=708437 RepID=A0A9P6T539_9BASI|nr:hypothetical protein CROQUDRAFT_137291 [Cronartium quercuum f. sp. fusiforme G11]